MTRLPAVFAVLAAFMAAVIVSRSPSVAAAPAPADATTEKHLIEQWRAARVAELTAADGWLTLVGLYWLEPGANSFGRAASNRLVLNHPALAADAGTFILDSAGVHFSSRPGSGITLAGHPVSTVNLVADTRREPTVLASGSLRFFIIERAGKMGVRVRDVDSPLRRHFTRIDYYPIAPEWVFNAHFEPYEPHRQVRIINILGQEQYMDCPGALVFSKDGREWRLDALLESPDDQALFVMFADATNSHGSYGGGRFLHVPLPAQGAARVDFNEAYNPPCAFSNFATCPLPPPQNKLQLPIEAGEKAYGSGHGP